jgi:RsiW-degrading membrane proteinase PrsW (M82 family)
MSALTIVTLLVCMATLTICIAVARRAHWRAAVLYLLVGLVPLAQVMFLVKEKLGWKLVIPSLLTDIAECLVSVLFLLAMFLIRKDALRQSNSEARLRLTEAMLCSDAGPVEKQLETDQRLSEFSKTLNRAPSPSAAKS